MSIHVTTEAVSLVSNSDYIIIGETFCVWRGGGGAPPPPPPPAQRERERNIQNQEVCSPG